MVCSITFTELSSTLQIVFWESSFPIRPVGRSGEKTLKRTYLIILVLDGVHHINYIIDI